MTLYQVSASDEKLNPSLNCQVDITLCLVMRSIKEVIKQYNTFFLKRKTTLSSHSPDLDQQQLFVDRMLPHLNHILNCYQHIIEYHKPVHKMISESNIIAQCEFKTFECPALKARLMNRIQPQSIKVDEQKNNKIFAFPSFFLKKRISSVQRNKKKTNILKNNNRNMPVFEADSNDDDKREFFLQLMNLIHCVLFHDPMEKIKNMSKKRGKRFYSLTDLFVSPYANSHNSPSFLYAASTSIINSPLIKATVSSPALSPSISNIPRFTSSDTFQTFGSNSLTPRNSNANSESIKQISLPRMLNRISSIAKKMISSVSSPNPKIPENISYCELKNAPAKSPEAEAFLLNRTSSLRWSRKSSLSTTYGSVLMFGVPFIADKNDARFKNLKLEVLNNDFVVISARQWNVTLEKVLAYRNTWLGRRRSLTSAMVISIKLYTDFNMLQNAFSLAFRRSLADTEMNYDSDFSFDAIATADYFQRQKQFYHWFIELRGACKKGETVIRAQLFHGVNRPLTPDWWSSTYYGPLSTTFTLEVAVQFAQNGSVFEIQTAYGSRALPTKWCSDYPEENEVLLLSKHIVINRVMDPSNENFGLDQDLFSAFHKISCSTKVLNFSNVSHRWKSLSDEQKRIIQHFLAERKFRRKSRTKRLKSKKPLDTNSIETKEDNDSDTKLFEKYFHHLTKTAKGLVLDSIPPELENIFYDDSHALSFETIVSIFPNLKELSIDRSNFNEANYLAFINNKNGSKRPRTISLDYVQVTDRMNRNRVPLKLYPLHNINDIKPRKQVPFLPIMRQLSDILMDSEYKNGLDIFQSEVENMNSDDDGSANSEQSQDPMEIERSVSKDLPVSDVQYAKTDKIITVAEDDYVPAAVIMRVKNSEQDMNDIKYDDEHNNNAKGTIEGENTQCVLIQSYDVNLMNLSHKCWSIIGRKKRIKILGWLRDRLCKRSMHANTNYVIQTEFPFSTEFKSNIGDEIHNLSKSNELAAELRFEELCNEAQSLVLDLIPIELEKNIFYDKTYGKKYRLSFLNIVAIFPHLKDLFVTRTLFNIHLLIKFNVFCKNFNESKLDYIQFSMDSKLDVYGSTILKHLKELEYNGWKFDNHSNRLLKNNTYV